MADNKTVVYAIAGVSLVATATGIVYYTTDMGKSWNQDNSSISKPRTSRGKRKGRKDVEESRKGEGVGEGGSSTSMSLSDKTYCGS